MLDKVISRYSALRHSTIDTNYTPQQAVQAKKLTNPHGKNLTILLPPWHGGSIVYDALTRRLVATGSAVLSYQFHKHILEPNIANVLDSFGTIRQTVTDDIAALVAVNGYSGVDFIASSLGNVSLCQIASAYPAFRKATMVVAGSNLARSAWEGSRTQDLRMSFEAQGVSESELDAAWADLAPMKHAEAFKVKQVSMFASTSDTVIPAAYQAEMVEAIRAVNAHVAVHSSPNGHAAAISQFCLRGPL